MRKMAIEEIETLEDSYEQYEHNHAEKTPPKLVNGSVLLEFHCNAGVWRKCSVLTPYYGDYFPNQTCI